MKYSCHVCFLALFFSAGCKTGSNLESEVNSTYGETIRPVKFEEQGYLTFELDASDLSLFSKYARTEFGDASDVNEAHLKDYRGGELRLSTFKNKDSFIPVKVKSRGRTRLLGCAFTPLTLKFIETRNLWMPGAKGFKAVGPCIRFNKNYSDLRYEDIVSQMEKELTKANLTIELEHLAYQLWQLVSDQYHVKSRLAVVNIMTNTDFGNKSFSGLKYLLLEDESDLEKRTQGKWVESYPTEGTFNEENKFFYELFNAMINHNDLGKNYRYLETKTGPMLIPWDLDGSNLVTAGQEDAVTNAEDLHHDFDRLATRVKALSQPMRAQRKQWYLAFKKRLNVSNAKDTFSQICNLKKEVEKGGDVLSKLLDANFSFEYLLGSQTRTKEKKAQLNSFFDDFFAKADALFLEN